MASPFDDAWPVADTALAAVMGEALFISGVALVDAVVSEVEAGTKLGGMSVSSGVAFRVHLSRAQIAVLVDPAEGGATVLKGKAVRRGGFKGRVFSVLDLGGAGAELAVEPLSSGR
jgi:hypothetical protein